MSKGNEALDYTMIALSDPTRRAILEILFKGEQRVTELAKPFDMSLNSVSKHIRLLERAGLVERRKSGRDHFIRFNPQPLEDTARWIDERRGHWQTTIDSLTNLINAEKEAKKPRKWLPWS